MTTRPGFVAFGPNAPFGADLRHGMKHEDFSFVLEPVTADNVNWTEEQLVGTVVMYHGEWNGVRFAAPAIIVTAPLPNPGDSVGLFVMGGGDYGMRTARYSQGKEPGTWHFKTRIAVVPDGDPG